MLINSLYQLSQKAQRKGWIDISIQAESLARSLEDKGYKEKRNSSPTPIDMFGKTFPAMDLQLEAHIGELLFRFEPEQIDHVPTLFIHSKASISEEDFEQIVLELEDVVPEIDTFELKNQFMIVETHSYCVNLNDHMNLIYGVLTNVLYGQYENPDDSEQGIEDLEDDNIDIY